MLLFQKMWWTFVINGVEVLEGKEAGCFSVLSCRALCGVFGKKGTKKYLRIKKGIYWGSCITLYSSFGHEIHMDWVPLGEGILKINFDGASFGNPGPAGYGCIMRDSQGVVK